MSLHVFGSFVTPFGTAANNRAETEGNVTTLQKLIWLGASHSTVSAEAIRFALRRLFATIETAGANRGWAEHPSQIPPEIPARQRANLKPPCNFFRDPDFEWYSDASRSGYIDDDVLGFMSAEASAVEGEAGTANVRRGVLEVTRAVSLTPWAGDVTFNAASAGATPSAQKKGSNPVPYGAEVHATRYQYAIALTPERLRDRTRAGSAVEALCKLGTVAGNHGRFLFDFSPDSVVFRITDDPAPRLLYCFETPDDGKTVDAPALLDRVKDGDIKGEELIIGGAFARSATAQELASRGAFVGMNGQSGVKAAAAEAVKRINGLLNIKG